MPNRCSLMFDISWTEVVFNFCMKSSNFTPQGDDDNHDDDDDHAAREKKGEKKRRSIS